MTKTERCRSEARELLTRAVSMLSLPHIPENRAQFPRRSAIYPPRLRRYVDAERKIRRLHMPGECSRSGTRSQAWRPSHPRSLVAGANISSKACSRASHSDKARPTPGRPEHANRRPPHLSVRLQPRRPAANTTLRPYGAAATCCAIRSKRRSHLHLRRVRGTQASAPAWRQLSRRRRRQSAEAGGILPLGPADNPAFWPEGL